MNLEKKRVLFICTHNSARSQMAEGLLRYMYGDEYEAYSAGTQPASVNPLAVKVMAEIGIDMSKHRSKDAREFLGDNFDYVVTLCDTGEEVCPFFPGAREYLHKNFRDPVAATGEEALDIFRDVRDEIKRWIIETFCRK